jgi:hypothetical protein
MTRADACHRLVDLLRLDLIGDLLDVIDDPDVRDLVLKVMNRARDLTSDEDEAAKPAPPTGGP